MSYFPTPYTNITGIVGWGQYANDLTAGYMGLFFLLALAFVSLAVTRGWGNRKSLMVTSFVSFVISVLLRTMGWLLDIYVMACMGIMLFLMAFFYLKDE